MGSGTTRKEETRPIIPLYPAYMAKSRSAGKKSGNGGKGAFMVDPH